MSTSFMLEAKDTTAQMHNSAGLAFFYQGKYSQAFEEFLQALKKDPNNAVAQFNLGRIFEQQGRYKDAFIQYQRALSLEPTHPGAKSGFERLRKYEEKPKLKVKTEDEILEEKAKKEGALGEEAREDLLKKRLQQVQELMDKQNFQPAYDLVQKSLSLFPQSPDLHFYLGRYFYDQGQYPQAIESVRKSLELKIGEEDIAHYLLGISYEALGDFNRAEDQIKKALSLAPSNSLFYQRLGQVMTKMGKPQSAWEQFKQGVEVNPSSVEGRVSLNKLSKELSLKTYNDGKLFFETRDYAKARDLLTQAIKYGELPPQVLEDAKATLGITEYWVQKLEKISRIRETQIDKTQEIKLRKDIRFKDAVNAKDVYMGEYVAWQGTVIGVEQKNGYYEILVDTSANSDFQSDVIMSSFFLVHVVGRIPDDKRLSYLGQADIEGKFKEVRYLRNPFNKQSSQRQQPVVYLTDGRFSNPSSGSGFVRVYPHTDYRE